MDQTKAKKTRDMISVRLVINVLLRGLERQRERSLRSFWGKTKNINPTQETL